MPHSDVHERYTRTAIVLHWLIAILVIGQFAWGWWMQEIPKQPVGPRVDAFNLHKSVGMVILALMALRLLWRIGHPAPPLPPMPSWQAALARATHVLLYAALLVQPLVGYLGSEVSGYPVKVFGMTLPGWAGKNVANWNDSWNLFLAADGVIACDSIEQAGELLDHWLESIPDDKFRRSSRLTQAMLSSRLNFPADKARRIVLFSDGIETHGELNEAMDILEKEHIDVCFYKLNSLNKKEVCIKSFKTIHLMPSREKKLDLPRK